ncbi:MAG: L-serine ammonia-lyase, iron-sulfur-dependent, subunit alpha [Fimbriimonadia bacterium]|jgi:L-serine dehydratase
MNAVSILNEVLGPIMFGPSSSHTAGSYHIGRLARDLLGEPLRTARIAFDPAGSYAQLYREQGSDRAFVAGLLGWDITDDRFHSALAEAERSGVSVEFVVEPLAEADHPNTVELSLTGVRGTTLHVVARSIGGGAIEIVRLNGMPILLRGDANACILLPKAGTVQNVIEMLRAQGVEHVASSEPLLIAAMEGREQPKIPDEVLEDVWTVRAIFYPRLGSPPWRSSAELLARGGERLGESGLFYECAVLGLDEQRVLAEVLRRYDVMRESVHTGLCDEDLSMQLLRPVAGAMMKHEHAGALPVGGLHARAAARAMAVMHVNGAMGRLCAAPTAGSAGVLPGVLVTLEEECGVDRERIALGLLAAGAVGVVIAERATFAAEVAGCQVEIGASGAMAAAAVVDIFGGSARQACDAAAISLQNTMGMVCDLVQGIVEIPCHTRNAVAASSAFVCADLVMAGYQNPVSLDETVDAVYAVGKMLPPELRCTSKGGLAVTPSAKNLRRLRVL